MIVGFKEKRRLSRIDLNIPLRYQVRGIPKANTTRSNNISLGGLGFVNNRFVAPKVLVELEFNILSRVLRPVGKIAWASVLPHCDNYNVGVEFLEFDPEEKNYLEDFLSLHTTKL